MIGRNLSALAGKQILRLIIIMGVGVCGVPIIISGGTIASGQVPSEPDPIAHDPYLVKDIITTTQGIVVADGEQAFASVNGYLFLSIDDGDHGYELWKSDGSESGTMLVKDIEPDGSSNPRFLLDFNGVLYFAATDYEHGNELWKSDGTEAGTMLVKDIEPDGSSGPRFLLDFNGVLYFAATDYEHGNELWKSDGTEAGTVLVKDIYPGGDESGPYSSSPHKYVDVNGILFFAVTSPDDSNELWKSDGTETGTLLVKDIHPEQFWTLGELVAVNNNLYFTLDTHSQFGCELWKSDGTAAGTVLLKDINPNYESCARNLTDHGGMLYFTVDDGVHGNALWKSDGTEAGTQLVNDIYVSEGNIHSLTSMGEMLYFSVTDVIHGCELWKSDGSEAGTTLVIGFEYISDYDYCVAHLTVFNGELLFTVDDGVHGRDIWKSDGTGAGTVMVKDILTGSIECTDYGKGGYWCYVPTPDHLTVVDNTLFFTTDEVDHGIELWSSDGTEPGTLLVKDINTETEGINIYAAASMDGMFYFAADDRVHGIELWRSDGSDDGTRMVADINPSGSSEPSSLIPFNGALYFTADNGTHGAELWKSDGTEAGTKLVKDIWPGGGPSYPIDLTVFNNALYFSAYDGDNAAHGAELWKSDGTEEGTVLVKDINPVSSSSPVNLMAVNNSLYFSADDGTNGFELWKSDGTESGTVLVKDIYPGWISSGPYSLTDLNGMLIFVARDATHGVELWRSDGTEVGTTLIKDITPNDSIYIYQFPRQLTLMENMLYFSADDGINGADLWKSDGTEEGTVKVKDIFPEFLAAANGVLFFGNYGSLWKSDGSEAGTVLVKNISPWIGWGDSRISNPIGINGVLFLAADDWTHGTELWKSDGTQAGTVMVADINPRVGQLYKNSSFPTWLTDVSGTLFFLADDSTHGSELWAYPYIVSRQYLPMLIR